MQKAKLNRQVVYIFARERERIEVKSACTQPDFAKSKIESLGSRMLQSAKG